MYRNRIPKLEPDDLTQWLNLEWIRMHDSKIESLDRNLFRNNSKLRTVNFNANLIQNLERDLFKQNPRIWNVFFWNNKIENVGKDLLSHLNPITVADFGSNSCIDEQAGTPEQFVTLKANLLVQCPELDTTETPQTSTTESSCSPRCSINEEVDEMRASLNIQEETIKEQQLEIERLSALAISHSTTIEANRNSAEEQAKRIENLEMIVREFMSSPCSC